MMEGVRLTRPAPALLDYIAENMAEADRAELGGWAAGGVPPRRVLHDSVRYSEEAFVAIVDGVILGAFGIVNAGHGVGIPWFLGTEELHSGRKALKFLRGSRVIVDSWMNRYDLLTNITDARHAAAHKWLLWLGFNFVHAYRDKLDPASPPYLRFERTALKNV